MQILNDPTAFWNSIPTESSPVWPVICIDFNGVLDQYRGFNGTVEFYDPAPGASDFLECLSGMFNTIVIFTATIPLDGVLAWLQQHDLAKFVDYVSNWKVPAAVYVDDRAVTHRGDFTETLEQISSFTPWWKL